MSKYFKILNQFSFGRLAKGITGLTLLALFTSTSGAHIDLQRAGTHVAKYEQGALGAGTKVGSCGNPEEKGTLIT